MIDQCKIISYGTKVIVRLEDKVHEIEIVQSKEVDPDNGRISA